MIYFSGLGSIIESIYLGEPLGDNRRQCKIYVNPDNVTYLAWKVVIVNSLRYPLSAIQELLRNRNKVVLRVAPVDIPEGCSYNPYILRPNFNVVWNGVEIEGKEGWGDGEWEKTALEWCSYDSPKLYFPKLLNLPSTSLTDTRGSLFPLGWLMEQVGQEVTGTSLWKDLDLLKTLKMQL